MAAAEPVLIPIDTLTLTGLGTTESAPIAVEFAGGEQLEQGVLRGGNFAQKAGTADEVTLRFYSDEAASQLLHRRKVDFAASGSYQQIESPIWVPAVAGLWVTGETATATGVRVDLVLFVEKACLASLC